MDNYILSEDLAVWFGKKKKKKGSKQPKGPWVNICRKKKGGGHPSCGRKDADKGAYPVCRAAGVASKMSQSAKDSACRRKREKEKKDPQSGKGQKPTNEPSKIKELLVNQIEKPVRWREIVNYMIDKNINKFIEIGPGKVLSGLVKRINRNVELLQINDLEDLKKFS